MLKAIITARGGSKGIPRKNIKILRGKPLMAYCYEAARDTNRFDEIILSTDDDEIASLGKSIGMSVPYIRPAELAKDDSKSIDVVIELINNLRLDGSICLLQPTSPLVNPEDINGAIDLHYSAKKNIFTACQEGIKKSTLFDYENMKLHLSSADSGIPRQSASTFYRINGAVFLCTIDSLKEQKKFITEDSLPYFMPQSRSIDIDTMLELEIASFLLGYEKSCGDRG